MELTQQDRKLIADTVLRDGRLPLEMRDLLFPEERREATLAFSGKSRKEDVIADTMAVPLQPIRTFGSSRSTADDWSNSLIFGDNLQALKTLLQQKRSGHLQNEHGDPGVQLIYIDPPFASSRDFGAKKGEVAYQDKVIGAEFLEFLRRRLILLRELLSETGSIFVHLDSKKGHYAKVILDEIFGEENFRNEIVWHYYNKMQGNVKRFASNHDVIFWYSKSSTYTFNPQQEDRETPVRQIKRVWDKDGQKLVNAKGADGKVLYQDSTVKTVDDVWRLSMLQPADRSQNMSYPTQKPEALAARIIEAASRPGDIVLDAFAGSGTALAVAEKLERRWIGIDCGKLAIYTIQKRLLTLKKQIGNKGRRLQAKPFTLYNAGLYDFSALRALPWADWRFFGLTLFECQDSPHQVSGVNFDGYRHGSDVIVFDHLQAGGVVLDRGYIEDLHRNLGGSASETTFVIAPAASVTFFEDYIDIDESRYYILRIPYSIINELHRRPFAALKQPLSEESVNRTIDSVGFDFMKKPRVSCTYEIEQTAAGRIFTVRIDEFRSEALAKGVAATMNRETLAAVLLDYNYPETEGEAAPPFVLDQVYYAAELAESEWTIRVPEKSLGSRMMLIYLDIYGNEYTELKQTLEWPGESDNTRHGNSSTTTLEGEPSSHA
ncbi:DNA methyltransferase [Sinomonas humi]|uniref:DNA methyltransferase n=1 Tax=Sinomonas humi TaxID=1338436 RepID=UPI00068BA27F|nr:site-specific DNA-methyltransferase [Sinomonas humi]